MNVRALLVASALVVASLATTAVAQWSPDRFTNEDTLELSTISADGDEHWSTVWLVVIDGQVYVRLGNRAAKRVNTSTRAPLVDVRLGKEVFHNVRLDPAPEMAERVATAMADKYWSDFLVRYFEHPLTARLVAQDSGRI
jgi:hypothetical protein